MSKFTTALLSTGVGIALIIGVKAQSAGSPRSALDDARHLRAGRVSSVAPPSSSAAASSKTGGSGSGAGPSGRYTGSVTETPYGPVQVRAVLDAGKLAGVTVLQQTFGGRSSQIDSFALPILKAEALKAQSGDIDVVSGATYTSDGYAQSLQAALDSVGR